MQPDTATSGPEEDDALQDDLFAAFDEAEDDEETQPALSGAELATGDGLICCLPRRALI